MAEKQLRYPTPQGTRWSRHERNRPGFKPVDAEKRAALLERHDRQEVLDSFKELFLSLQRADDDWQDKVAIMREMLAAGETEKLQSYLATMLEPRTKNETDAQSNVRYTAEFLIEAIDAMGFTNEELQRVSRDTESL